MTSVVAAADAQPASQSRLRQRRMSKTMRFFIFHKHAAYTQAINCLPCSTKSLPSASSQTANSLQSDGLAIIKSAMAFCIFRYEALRSASVCSQLQPARSATDCALKASTLYCLRLCGSRSSSRKRRAPSCYHPARWATTSRGDHTPHTPLSSRSSSGIRWQTAKNSPYAV